MAAKHTPEPASNSEKSPSKSKGARRGFAAMSPEQRREIAQKGGEAVSRNRSHMTDIGRKGGQANSRDRSYMSEIGRKGGQAISRDKNYMAEIGQRGGETTQENKERAQSDEPDRTPGP